MGKWVEVKCNCPGRDAPTRDPVRPHIFIYPCGHEDGCLFQVWPGNLFEISYLLDELRPQNKSPGEWFPWFAAISNPRRYCDEYLAIPVSATAKWRKEIDDVRAISDGRLAVSEPFARRWETAWNAFFDDEFHREDAKSLNHILGTGLKLCEASVTTGNPIEFYW